MKSTYVDMNMSYYNQGRKLNLISLNDNFFSFSYIILGLSQYDARKNILNFFRNALKNDFNTDMCLHLLYYT